MFQTLRPVAHKSAVWLLRTFNPGTIRIRHHHTGDRVALDAFKHKGYWYHGKRREAKTMELFRELVGPDDTVFEVGGHIGYISVYFAHLVGPQGRVVVFEPSTENLRYLRRNVQKLPQVSIVEQAVGSACESREFYVENLSGQNNSFYADYDIFKQNASFAGYGGYHVTHVEVTTGDEFCRANGLQPDFVKIDIEGAELEALQGMSATVESARPRLMVEVSREIDNTFDWLLSRDYFLYDEDRRRLREPTGSLFNAFCLHQIAHRADIERLGLDASQN
jgi:FkbM family methyltransferase